LLDFSITPVLFDTSAQDATVSFCVTASDDLSGVADVGVRADSPSSTPISGFFGISLNFQGATNATVCGSAVIPKGSPFEVEPLLITLTDRVGNTRLVGNPLNLICADSLFGQCENLCELSLPCVGQAGDRPDASHGGMHRGVGGLMYCSGPTGDAGSAGARAGV